VKFFLKLLLKAGFTLGIMFFGYKYLLTGYMGGGDVTLPGTADMTGSASKGIKSLGNAVSDKDVTVYQWVDDKGVTHFGGSPPTGQGEYIKRSIQANTNVINAVKPRKKEPKIASSRSRSSRVGQLYSKGGIKNLMDNTKETSQQMSDQITQQDKALQDIMGQIDTKK